MACCMKNRVVRSFNPAPNKALHLTTIPLRSIAAGELGRYVSKTHQWRIP